ncbi:uncharacterized protein [Lolium perenne]|uniref:uncharacterized protein isoform X3 n=1 Tax=Lolium perenne TaxID=4522 RepID=UPI003A9A461A
MDLEAEEELCGKQKWGLFSHFSRPASAFIAAEALQGPIRKRALDQEDPDPHAVGHKHKMGRTHTSRPDLPSASAKPPIVEHATPLEAMVGQEFLDKLATRGQKKKAPAPEAGTSDAPPSKRSRKEIVAGKEVTSKRYRKREMPVSSGAPWTPGSISLKSFCGSTGSFPKPTANAKLCRKPPSRTSPTSSPRSKLKKSSSPRSTNKLWMLKGKFPLS